MLPWIIEKIRLDLVQETHQVSFQTDPFSSLVVRRRRIGTY
jgi:hypothetical protein